MTTKFTIFGACASRDIFNSKINFDYKDYFQVDGDAFQTSFISMMAKPVVYDEKLIDKFDGSPNDSIRYRFTKKEFERVFLKYLKKSSAEYMIIDTYFDVRQGVIKIPSQHTSITNTPYIKLSDFYKNIDDASILTIQNNTSEFLKNWVESCDKFFNYIENYSPKMKIILNPFRSSTKFLNNDGSLTEKKSYGRFIKNHCYRSLLDEYILQNYDVDVLIFDKEYYLDPNYIFGFAEVHYAYPYFEEVNKQLKEIILNNKTFDEETNKRIRSFKRNLAISLFNENIVINHQQKQLLKISNLNYILNSKLIRCWEKSLKDLSGGSYHSSGNDELLNIFMLARFDVKNIGSEFNNVELLEISDSECNISRPKWIKDDVGSGFILQSNKRFLNFNIKCVGEGKLIFKLRGPDFQDRNKNNYKIYIDFTSFRINGKEYLNENRLTNMDSPYKISVPVSNGDVLNINAKWLSLNPSRISNYYK